MRQIGQKTILFIVATGVLPLLLMSVLVAMILSSDNLHAAGGVDALGLAALCFAAYIFACLVLLPTLLSLPYLIHRRRLVNSTKLVCAAGVAIGALALPLIYLAVPPAG